MVESPDLEKLGTFKQYVRNGLNRTRGIKRVNSWYFPFSAEITALAVSQVQLSPVCTMSAAAFPTCGQSLSSSVINTNNSGTNSRHRSAVAEHLQAAGLLEEQLWGFVRLLGPSC